MTAVMGPEAGAGEEAFTPPAAGLIDQGILHGEYPLDEVAKLGAEAQAGIKERIAAGYSEFHPIHTENQRIAAAATFMTRVAAGEQEPVPIPPPGTTKDPRYV